MFIEYFYNSEKLLRKRLGKNPYYPFMEVQPKVFVYSFSPKQHILAIAVCVLVASVTAIIVGVQASVDEYIVIPCLIFAYFFPYMFSVRGTRTLVVEIPHGYYEYYVGEDLLCRGHLHNIYVRVKRTRVAGTGFYKVVIGGYGIDTIDVTKKQSQHHEKLYHLARTMALNLGINFFDYEDVSARHTIVHRCPTADVLPETNIRPSAKRLSIRLSSPSPNYGNDDRTPK